MICLISLLINLYLVFDWNKAKETPSVSVLVDEEETRHLGGEKKNCPLLHTFFSFYY